MWSGGQTAAAPPAAAGGSSFSKALDAVGGGTNMAMLGATAFKFGMDSADMYFQWRENKRLIENQLTDAKENFALKERWAAIDAGVAEDFVERDMKILDTSRTGQEDFNNARQLRAQNESELRVVKERIKEFKVTRNTYLYGKPKVAA